MRTKSVAEQHNYQKYNDVEMTFFNLCANFHLLLTRTLLPQPSTSCYCIDPAPICSLSLCQTPSKSTSVFQLPTDGRGADIIPMPATLTGSRGTRTTITTHTANTPTGNITTTERSTMTMTRAVQSVTGSSTPQVRSFTWLHDMRVP